MFLPGKHPGIVAENVRTAKGKGMSEADAVKEAARRASGRSKKNLTAAGKIGKAYAGPNGTSFPIASPVDVKNAAMDIGRTNQDKGAVKSNIKRIAAKMGPAYEAEVPSTWKGGR